MIKTISAWLLSVVLGALFIVSAVAKLFPIEYFENTLVDYGVANWAFVTIISRLIISLEIALGLLLIGHVALKRFTIPLMWGVLLAFTLFLFFVFLRDGDVDNCGCFGTLLPLSHSQSILKNCVMIVLGVIVFKTTNFTYTKRWSKWLIVGIVIGAIATIMIVNPPINIYETPPVPLQERVGTSFIVPESLADKLDVSEGEHMILMFSASCSHCRALAHKAGVMSRKGQLPKTWVIINGDEKDIQKFYIKTNIDFPYFDLKANEFLPLAGNRLPVYFRVKDGVLVETGGNNEF